MHHPYQQISYAKPNFSCTILCILNKLTQTACFGQKQLVDMNADDLFNRNSMKKEVFFLGISVIWTAATGAIQPAEISDENWASVARI